MAPIMMGFSCLSLWWPCHILLGCEMHSQPVNVPLRNAGDVGGKRPILGVLKRMQKKLIVVTRRLVQRAIFLSLCLMEAVFLTFILFFSFAVYSFQANIRGMKTDFCCFGNVVLKESTYRTFKVVFNANASDIFGTFLNLLFTFQTLMKYC